MKTKYLVMIAFVIIVVSMLLMGFKSYYTPKIKKDSPDNTIQTMKLDAMGCKAECDKMNNCAGFVSLSDDTCMLKSSISGLVDKDGSTVFIK